MSGVVVVTELVDGLGVIKLLDAVIGQITARGRGFTGGQVLVGLAAAQVAGEGFLVGLDRQRAEVAAQVLAAVAGLRSTTAAGLARRCTEGQWRAVQTGDRGHAHRDARGAATGAGGAVRCGHDRSGHHRRGGLRPQETWGGRPLPGATLRAPAGGHLGPRPRRCWPRT